MHGDRDETRIPSLAGAPEADLTVGKLKQLAALVSAARPTRKAELASSNVVGCSTAMSAGGMVAAARPLGFLLDGFAFRSKPKAVRPRPGFERLCTLGFRGDLGE